MQSFSTIASALQASLAQAVPSWSTEELASLRRSWSVEIPSSPDHGQATTNLALQLFGKLPSESKASFQQPRLFAAALVESLNADPSMQVLTEKIEVAGPGFINFYFSHQSMLEQLVALQKQVSTGVQAILTDAPDPSQYAGKKVLVEFTDPNPFKELHIGHAYSNIVGESIARLIEAAGGEVLRVCYQGDVGMHVAKSVWGMQQKLQDESLTLADVAARPLSERLKFLGQAYSLGATHYEDDDAAKQAMKEINFSTYSAAQRRLVESEGWQPQIDYQQFLTESELDHEYINELYQAGRAWSLEYFDVMYARLGMQFDDFFFESLVGEFGLKIVREFLAAGIFEESNGAIIFPGSKYGLHDRVFVNSLGLPTYEAKELGLAPEKYRRHQYDVSIIITANEINEYFKVLLKAMSLTSPELAAKTRHLSHGMVRLPEGKMSSRTGKVLTAEWLLDEAKERITQRMTETRPEWSADERASVAQPVSLAAIKYAFLKSSIGGDIAFSFDESLSFTGQSGPYLQYMAVRCQSIFDKAKLSLSTVSADFSDLLRSKADLSDPACMSVVTVLLQYPLVLQKAVTELAPHHLALYLFEVAQAFSAFYDTTPILQEPDTAKRQLRLAITAATLQTLISGLALLGIETVKKM